MSDQRCLFCGAHGGTHSRNCYLFIEGHDIPSEDIVATEGYDPLKEQVGGDHYKKLKIQPAEYNHANNIPFMEGNIIKYATRWRDKGGLKDLLKIKHFVDLLIKLEGL